MRSKLLAIVEHSLGTVCLLLLCTLVSHWLGNSYEKLIGAVAFLAGARGMDLLHKLEKFDTDA